ncbi:MAG: sigma 54-interacting transcriptional regulator [Polyangiaceae bacterium]
MRSCFLRSSGSWSRGACSRWPLSRPQVPPGSTFAHRTRTASSARAPWCGSCARRLASRARPSSTSWCRERAAAARSSWRARALHALSARTSGPFVARNAATLPEGLVDAELFGSVRGYPHATSPERPGLIGQAEGGTLFLDEMAELAHDLQSHLLRVLDEGGDYQRLGDARPRRANVRLVAATNRPIEHLKHDLAARFRLRVPVPGLNDRREAIPLLLRHLLARAVRSHPALAAAHGPKANDPVKLSTALDPALVGALARHRYSHHLRELDQLLWLALSTSPVGRVGLKQVVQAQLAEARARHGGGVQEGRDAGEGEGRGAGGAREGVSREAIEAALSQTGGKVAPAARLLGLGSRHALYRLMEKHGVRRAAVDGEADE